MKELLATLLESKSLSHEQAVSAFEKVMSGEATQAQTAALLSLLQAKGPGVDEITGAAKVMRSKAAKVTVPPGLTAIDTCGTGGDHAGTFNISTAAAIVAAAAGRPMGLCVAKHGNRAVTSKSGSSQVLEALGVTLTADGPTLTRCLDEAGLCFCFAPHHHPAMKHAGSVRAELGFRTVFNLVGPLTNPAGAKRQVMGVYSSRLTKPIAEVLKKLGAEHAMVVHGQIPDPDGKHVDGLDELSTCGPSTLGLSYSHPTALRVEGPEQSAAVIRKVLANDGGPAQDIVALNAAAALVVGGVAEDFAQGLEQANRAIESSDAATTLRKLVEMTRV
jgi:anthranilate phosphoribosyltransferase